MEAMGVPLLVDGSGLKVDLPVEDTFKGASGGDGALSGQFLGKMLQLTSLVVFQATAQAVC